MFFPHTGRTYAEAISSSTSAVNGEGRSTELQLTMAQNWSMHVT